MFSKDDVSYLNFIRIISDAANLNSQKVSFIQDNKKSILQLWIFT